jgi:hypothetical protein
VRYYDVTITNAKTGALIQPSYFKSLGVKSSYFSSLNGQPLPAALNIELDIPVAPYAQPRQGAWVRIWGISLQEISQSGGLNFADIVIKAGMQKGLPLATAASAQAGIIMQGTIFQCYGNWIGTEMTLDMTLLPAAGTDNKPVNLTWNSPKQTPMGQAIRQTLSTAFPGFKITVAVSASLVLPYDQTGTYTKLADFASMIANISQGQQFQGIKPLGGGAYPGVSITIRGNEIVAFDGTANYGNNSFASPKTIAFQDLIGQPTWISPNQLNFKTVMRADLSVGDYIRMPATLATPYVLTAQGAAFPNTPARNATTFKGVFVITEVHHFGNFRQPDAASWVTVFDAAFVNSGT